LEEIGGYAFNTLRGLTLIGGQVKIDPSLLPDMLSAMDESGYGNNPTGMILDLIKPAALTFLEIESAAMESQQRKDEAAGAEKDEKDGDDKLDINWSTLELDFVLTQKSYSLSINAMSMLATNRPTFFEDSARALALRTMDLPTSRDGGADDTPHRNAMLDSALNKGSAKAIQSQLKASCLTLLRNTLSVTAGGFEILRKALISAGMQIQADKALKVAKQQAELKKAGRAARNRAAIFYEWEAAPDERSSKRQKRTDDALAQMRSARAARGLGGGIQLPSSMTDACELVMLNIDNLPDQRPPGAAASSTDKRKGLTDLASLIDAVLSNGASLATEKGKWYNRDGGGAWTLEVDDDAVMEEGSKEVLRFALDPKAVEAAESIVSKGKVDTDEATRYDGQRTEAASEAFGRLVLRSSAARSKSLADLGNQIAGRLAWTLRNVRPSADLEAATNLAKETIDSLKKECAEGHAEDPKAKEVSAIENISKDYPLVPCCLTLNMTAAAQTGEEPTSALTSLSGVTPSLANRTLNEAYMQSFGAAESSVEPATPDLYESALDLYVSSVVSTCNAANNAPNDAQQKRAATVAAASLPQQLAMLPALGPSSLELTSSLCDIAEITKKAAEASKKSSDKTLAASASIHAAKAAAEKRATQALFALRDAAYQRSSSSSRRSAVDCAVGIASGRLPASPAVEGNALKLVMNVLYVKSADIADCVVAAATEELERTANYAIENFDRIQKANEEAKEEDDAADTNINPLKPSSDVEKEAMDKMRKPVVLFMALCVRRPDIIKTLFEKGSREKADALAKTIAVNMSKLSKAAVTKHGAAKVALQVAEMVDASETSLFLSFLENLVQKSDKAPPKQDLIDACHAIQEKRVGDDGKKDMRYIIPVLSGMTRDDLNAKLPDFVAADDDVFKKAQRRMSERLMKHALVFRDDPGKGEGLLGMTLCEQLVFLHQLDFAAVGLPQKRYLKSIEICLEEDKMFSDRVLMAALDYISGTFLTDRLKLPLAYMRTIILTCSKHESLHSWICHVLLPRLVEGKIYEDRRQWEGWMRCARMLENTGEGVSSLSAIESLPEEQKIIYRSKNPRKD
jgi:symplekin